MNRDAINQAVNKISELTGEDFHGYRSEIFYAISGAIKEQEDTIELEKLKADRVEDRKIYLNLESALPIDLLLIELKTAAETLLEMYSYDDHGYEGIVYACREVSIYINALNVRRLSTIDIEETILSGMEVSDE